MSRDPKRKAAVSASTAIQLFAGTTSKKDAQVHATSIRRIAAGLANPPGPPGAEYAAAKGEIIVYDDETGEPITLSTKTAVDLALERGDEGTAGVHANSAVASALPLLSDDVETSATLHMYIKSQRDHIEILSHEYAERNRARNEVLAREPMVWRRKRLAREFAAERVEEAKQLEAARVEEDKAVLRKARTMGLL